MDEMVLAALRKWPDVPACTGWLALDARGDWYMRDDRTQAAGPFPQSRGSRVEHDKLIGFIQRNYAADDEGRWFFQNGPQRVFVELEAAPRVWRLQPPTAPDAAPGIRAHAEGPPAGPVVACWIDEQGRLFLQTALGFGIVHSQDMGLAADALEAGLWPEPAELPFADMPGRFNFVLSPAASVQT